MKAEMNIQKPSTSESGKMEHEKNSKSDSQPKTADQHDKCFIDELRPKMLMKILKYLNVKSLANCRLVSRKWNGMARKILQLREDVETVFDCMKIEDGNFEIGGQTERSDASLNNFMKHFGDSKEPLLYSRFRFDNMTALVFDDADWIKFISDFGPSIKCLKLGIKYNLNRLNPGDEVIKLAEKSGRLHLNQLPKLEEFGLYLPCWFILPDTPAFENLTLFPTTTTTSTIQLAHLKVLYLDKSCFSHFTGIVTDLLRAAVNLQKIEPYFFFQSYQSIQTFQLLHSLGKLDCLQTAQLDLDAYFMSKIQGNSSMAFKLKKLLLNVSSIYLANPLWSDASVFISHLFESSKDTLRDLRMEPLGFLPDLQVPKFSKLINLTILAGLKVQTHVQAFPSKLNPNQFFPLLQNLELHVPWTAFPLHDESRNQDQNDSYFPSLNTLAIAGERMTKEDVSQISRVCPNLKNFTAFNLKCGGFGEPGNFTEVATAIWTRLKQLESLDLKIDVDSPTNAFPSIDSCFTGFSGEDCIRLCDLIENEKAAKKLGPKSESNIQLDAERINPSILDLKDLRKLEVYLYPGVPEYTSVGTNMLVSEEFAFKLMEKLTYEIKD